ncbi:unnamed protein product [Brugia timori]|uniref:Pre-rRNA-processing protein TSR2 homolog n=1 Tax=Brugia timori TaxID=42155 RepID=A0A0R3Q942_9BILA|nr:unnamed protein product [Brugia timori]
MPPHKFLEIISYFNDDQDTEGYFFACDKSVSPLLLAKLRRFIDRMESFDLTLNNYETQTVQMIDRKKVDLLLSVNGYIGNNRFNLVEDVVLTGEILDKFFKRYRGRFWADEVNDMWFEREKISFDLDDLSDTSTSEDTDAAVEDDNSDYESATDTVE